MLANYKRQVANVYAVIGLSCVSLSAVFYGLGLRPLVDRLKDEHQHELAHLLETGDLLVESVLRKHVSLAAQSASRTAIRHKQAAYLRGEVDQQELIAFSKPKLRDAVVANEMLLGITRYDPQGRRLFSAGLEAPASLVERRLLAGDRIRVRGPVGVGRKSVLMYFSPIDDPAHGRVGADVLLIRDDGLREIVGQEQQGVGVRAISQDKRVIYWPRNSGQVDARQALARKLAGDEPGSRHLIRSQPIEFTDWTLHVVADRDRFFAPINRQFIALLWFVAVLTALVLVAALVVLKPILATLIEEKRLYELSHRDGLTGLYNHAYFQELLKREMQRAERYGGQLSLLMLDIDHFKVINDAHGHPMGDEVLRRLSTQIAANLRVPDMAARYGGEEFAVILPETTGPEAEVLAERLRAVAESMDVQDDGRRVVPVTISVGVAIYDPACGKGDPKALITAADQALYTSKRTGRNRVTPVAWQWQSSVGHQGVT